MQLNWLQTPQPVANWRTDGPTRVLSGFKLWRLRYRSDSTWGFNWEHRITIDGSQSLIRLTLIGSFGSPSVRLSDPRSKLSHDQGIGMTAKRQRTAMRSMTMSCEAVTIFLVQFNETIVPLHKHLLISLHGIQSGVPPLRRLMTLRETRWQSAI